MAHKLSHAAIAAFLAAATWFAMAGDARAQGYGLPGWASPEPNYYAMPTGSRGPDRGALSEPPAHAAADRTDLHYLPTAGAAGIPVSSITATTRPITATHQVTRTSVTYGHRATLWTLQPSQTNSEPMLHTPVHVCDK